MKDWRGNCCRCSSAKSGEWVVAGSGAEFLEGG